MNELALFAGTGGGILGSYLLGWSTVAACEIEEYPRAVLLRRQLDGFLSRFPIWDDIKTFDGKPFKDRIDIITGGFPCQDISASGRGKGITGEKSGLWKEMARVVREVGPKFVFVENSPLLTSRGLGTVLSDLAEMGYNARWCVLGADDAGAPHIRKRIWILAYTNSQRQLQQERTKQKEREWFSHQSEKLANSSEINGRQRSSKQSKRKKFDRGSKEIPHSSGRGFEINQSDEENQYPPSSFGIYWWDYDPAILPNSNWLDGYDRGFRAGEVPQLEKTILSEREFWPAESRVGRVVNGMANRVDRLKAIGNGQVPAVEVLAFLILSEGLI